VSLDIVTLFTNLLKNRFFSEYYIHSEDILQANFHFIRNIPVLNWTSHLFLAIY